MCGIFGAVFVPPPSTRAVAAALDSMGHRGPDGRGVHREGDVTLGHLRLAILDLSDAGAQPMASADGQVIVVFNGEIYNHHEIRKELVALGHTFRSRSDTEVIVEGYRAWGDDVVRRLDGMFAFVAVDVPNRRLLAARDRAGKKPFFYVARGGGIAFASEVKALFEIGVPQAIDPTRLPDLLALGYVPAPHTIHAGVAQLPPGHLLTLRAGGTPNVVRYYHAPFDAPRADVSEREAEARVRELVEAAVVRRLEADVPVGAFLSGGIDSSIIAGIMARRSSHRVRTFSIGFSGDARFDETSYARLAAKAFGTDHTEFQLEPSSFEAVERLVEVHDGPFGDSSAIPTAMVSKLTRKHVTVALTGDGGDELFAGYTRFFAAQALEAIPAQLRARAGWLASVLPDAARERSLAARARRFFRAAEHPLGDRFVLWSPYFAGDLAGTLRPELAARLDLEQPFAWSRALLDRAAGSPMLTRILSHNYEGYLPYDLLVKADRSSMAHSLEVRSPFLDTALVDYASRLPPRLLRRGRWTKWILRRAFRDMLPDAILRRGKMGFGVPLGAWFNGELGGYLRDHLGARARIADYVRPETITRLLEEHTAGRADHGHRLWLLLTFELWLRRAQAGAFRHAPATRDDSLTREELAPREGGAWGTSTPAS